MKLVKSYRKKCYILYTSNVKIEMKITFGEHVLKYNTKKGTNPEIVCARKGIYIKSFLPRSDTGPKMYKLFKFY